MRPQVFLAEPKQRARALRGRLVDPFLITVLVFAIAKATLSRIVVIGPEAATSALWLESALLLATLCAASLVGKRGRIPVLVVYTVASVIMLANTLYAGYFGQLFDPAMLGLAGQTATLGGVVFGMLKPKHLLFIADLPFMAIWVYVAHSKAGVYRRAAAVIAVLAATVFAVQLVGAQKAAGAIDITTIASQRGLAAAQLSTLLLDRTASIPLARTTTNTDTAQPKTVAQEFGAQFGPYDPTAPAKRLGTVEPGVARGMNVVLIQWESLQWFLANAEVEGKQVMPEFDALASESWLFPRTYSVTGAGNTSDAEFVSLTGIPGPLTEPAVVSYTNHKVPSLPRLLRAQQGYKSYTMHTNHAGFWNRRELYASLGFDGFFDRSFFGSRDRMWVGASDEVLFEEGAKLLVRSSRESSSPVFLDMVTLTTHKPFDEPPAARRPLVLSEPASSTAAGRYLTSMSFTDHALGEFVRTLKREGLYDNTIIIVFGDHTAYQNEPPEATDNAVLDQAIGRHYGKVDRQRVPLLVHIPGQQEGHVIWSLRTQLDIMPTVAELTGLDTSATPHVGRSVFDIAPRLAPERYYYSPGAYVTPTMLVEPALVGSETAAYDIVTGKPVAPTTSDLAAQAYVRAMNRASNDWVLSQPVRRDAQPLSKAFIPGKTPMRKKK